MVSISDSSFLEVQAENLPHQTFQPLAGDGDTGFSAEKSLTVHSNNARPLTLLHVDDDENDRALVKEAIEITKTPFKYLGAPSLQTAVDLLESPSRASDSQPVQPALILLDYNLGSRCGVDFLYWLRTVKKTNVRVVMLSGSEDESEIAECYVHGANHFLTKPQNLDRIKNLVQRLYQCVTNSSESLRKLTEYRGNATEVCCSHF